MTKVILVMNFKPFIIVGLLLVGVVLSPTLGNAIKCEDIKGVEKWGGESHTDHTPSESKFYKALEEKTFCEVNKDIDHMIIKGEIKEGTHHDWDWFKTTLMYQSVDEKAQHKMWIAYSESPDSSGDMNLADYEMVESAY